MYLATILLILVGRYGLELVADLLNLRHVADGVPAEMAGYYDAERYASSQRYLKDHTRLAVIGETVQTALLVAFILFGGFNIVDRAARHVASGTVPAGLVFAGLLVLAGRLLSIPFAVYDTFVIEERYGFNRTTPRTFAFDILKGLLLTAILGGGVFAGVVWLFERSPDSAWLFCWGGVSALQVLLVFAAPYVILPLFNRYTALEEGELRQAIEDYARGQAFTIKGVFKMDGSRRSSKGNAFFTGFGRSRRIVLFDTLIAAHTVPEMVAIVAHELGHYRRKHVWQAMARSFLASGLVFFLLQFFIQREALFRAFGMEHVSPYAGLVLFGFLYAPIGLVLGVFENLVSRKHEFEADRFAVRTTAQPEAMVSALKRLSADTLANLAPHPLKVILSYSHPPILRRIEAMRRSADAPEE